MIEFLRTKAATAFTAS